jgi:hypothetical protein
MNKIDRKKLEKVIEICQCILDNKKLNVRNNERDLIPVFLANKTANAAKKENLVLKARQKPLGRWTFKPSFGGGHIECDLYKGCSFKTQ